MRKRGEDFDQLYIQIICDVKRSSFKILLENVCKFQMIGRSQEILKQINVLINGANYLLHVSPQLGINSMKTLRKTITLKNPTRKRGTRQT